MGTSVIGSMNYNFCVKVYCNFFRCFNYFGNSCTSCSLNIATARDSEMFVTTCDSISWSTNSMSLIINPGFVPIAVKTEIPPILLQSCNSAQYSDRWRNYVKAVKNLRFPWTAGKYFNTSELINFWWRTLLYAVNNVYTRMACNSGGNCWDRQREIKTITGWFNWIYVNGGNLVE